MSARAWIFGLACAAACVGTLAACNAVLGLGEATVDPSLTSGSDGATLDGASSDAGAGVDGADSANPYTCDSYCTAIMQACVGLNQEYTTRDVCMAMCSHLEPGVPGESSHDSLACRVYHTAAAAGDPDLHCRHAGPLGGGTCGDQPCDTFCLLDFALCGSRPENPYDGGESTCRSACVHFNYLASGDAGDLSLTSGDTLNCRLYHLESAYDLGNPAAQTTHCPHTGVVSATCN